MKIIAISARSTDYKSAIGLERRRLYVNGFFSEVAEKVGAETPKAEVKEETTVKAAAKEEKNVNNNITIDKLNSKEIIAAKKIIKRAIKTAAKRAAKEEKKVNNNITRNKLDSKEIERLVEDNKINIDESSKGDLEKLLRGEKIESKIKWIGTSGKKEITYTKIFILLHLIIEGGKEKFEREKRKTLINFIISNFVKFEKNKEKEIAYNTINGAYTNFSIDSLKK